MLLYHSEKFGILRGLHFLSINLWSTKEHAWWKCLCFNIVTSIF